MRIFFTIVSLLIAVGFNACAKPASDSKAYERANSASKESLQGLDRE